MKQNFEVSLEKLEKIVRELENGDLSLEESLKMFEEGVKLSRECQEKLNQAERRIEVLMEETDGELSVQKVETPDFVKETKQPKIRKRIVFDEDDEDDTPF